MQASQKNRLKDEYESRVASSIYAGNLFDNPMVREAIRNMSPETIESYKKFGDSLYGNIEYDKLSDPNYTPEQEHLTYQSKEVEYATYLCEKVKSGMHPSYLELEEKELLLRVFGREWYVKYGYTEGDLEKVNL